MATDEKIIKDAQYRKGLSIAFFNATNAATEIVKSLIKVDNSIAGQVKEQIVYWRDWLLEEHKNYYSKVIAGIGSVYNASDTIEKLKQVKTKDELRLVWISISEDERRDGDIIKVVKEIKETLKQNG